MKIRSVRRAVLVLVMASIASVTACGRTDHAVRRPEGTAESDVTHVDDGRDSQRLAGRATQGDQLEEAPRPQQPADESGALAGDMGATVVGPGDARGHVGTQGQGSGYGIGSRNAPAPPPSTTAPGEPFREASADANREGYQPVRPNPFVAVADSPLSTFSSDVDTASYSNVRRFLRDGSLPPVSAVRVEELVNYFHYDYPAPRGDDPVALHSEVGPCPWAPSSRTRSTRAA